ncbi:MAG: GGDEF domain-containing protein [Rhodocyclales bacterium]|nr:GGDEF domain-containing protein [Rhodocyclales bacterium]
MDEQEAQAPTQSTTPPERRRDDDHTPGNDRIMYSMGLAACMLLVPFTINNFIQGRTTVGTALSVINIALALNTHALWRRRPPPVPYVLLFVPFIAGITLATMQQGVPGMLWTYPVILFCYFVLSRRIAHLCCVSTLFYTTWLSWKFIDTAFATRLFGSLLLTIIMINIVLRVITDLNRALTHQALTDPLTGAFNRRFMEENLLLLVSRARRTPVVASMLMIDVDHFKDINDRHGHDRGDITLRRLVDLMRLRIRAGDRLCRWGGEEFMLLLEDVDLAGATKVAESIRKQIESTEIMPGHTVTVSIGVSQLDTDAGIDTWTKAADTALYRAKHEGRNRVVAHTRDT